MFWAVFFTVWLVSCGHATVLADDKPRLASERAVVSTTFGDVHLGFFPDVAPTTVKHIIKLFQLGCYNSNHFFRVDAGFVAQTADVIGGRLVPLSDEQEQEAQTVAEAVASLLRRLAALVDRRTGANVRVPLEVVPEVKHTEGILSMARSSDPNSGRSSFSVLLGASPHLDMEYTIFGQVLRGMEHIHKMEKLPTKKEGIFVMPLERVTIHSTFVIFVADPEDTLGTAWSLRHVDTGVTSLSTQKQAGVHCDQTGRRLIERLFDCATLPKLHHISFA